MRLANKHNIKEKLYNGDGLERIYNLLGDVRLIWWLIKSSEIEVEREEQWKMLTEFLEKEAKVHQQRSLIQQINVKATARKEDQIDSNKHRYNLANDNFQKICSFCGEGDHVATAGPNHTKIIQYFSCKTFVEMTPRHRFAELQKKSFHFWC